VTRFLLAALDILARNKSPWVSYTVTRLHQRSAVDGPGCQRGVCVCVSIRDSFLGTRATRTKKKTKKRSAVRLTELGVVTRQAAVS
jgi:hypothetical protein